MKKFVFSLLIFFGFFFVFGATNVDHVHADDTLHASVNADEYDERKISVELTGFYGGIEKYMVYEVEMCPAFDMASGCYEYTLDKTVYMKLLDNGTEYLLSQEAIESRTTVINYTINSNSDGKKYIYFEAIWSGVPYETSSTVIEYSLTTINQRVIINPDGNDNPLHVYDGAQYSPSRAINIKVNLFEDEISDVYSGIAYIVEVVDKKYSSWIISEGMFSFGLQSYGDGAKELAIYLINKGVTIDESNNVINQLEDKNKAKKISKIIHLDTIGPEITIEGGDWVIVPRGEKYTPKKATCVDATFSGDVCVPTNDVDANIVKIDYSSDKYQTVTYEATDRLGNKQTHSVRIKVEQEKSAKDNATYIIVTVGVGTLLLTVVILGYILIKNNEKKKKISYI